jgi:hypothetical protein
MKRVLFPLLVVALMSGMLFAGGCGGDTSKAKQYMKKGDEMSVQLARYGGGKQAAYDTAALLANLGINLAQGNTDLTTTGKKAKADIDKLIVEGKAAKAEYAKILDLNDVADYKEYSRLRIQAINSTTNVLQQVKGLIDTLMKPGTKSNTQRVTDWAKDHVAIVTDLAQAVLYWHDAATLKTDKNL